MEFIQGMANKGCAQVTRDKYADQQYLGLGTNLFALGSTSGITYFQNAIEDGYMEIGKFQQYLIQLQSL